MNLITKSGERSCMPHTEVSQEELLPLPTFRDVEHEVSSGSLPYVLAEIALHEVICLRVASGDGTKGAYASRLRDAVDFVADSVNENEFDPRLPEDVADKATEFSALLKHNDQVQRRRMGLKLMCDYGFYEFETNRYDEEAMRAAELLLATVVHHGRSDTIDGHLQPLDPLHVISGGKE